MYTVYVQTNSDNCIMAIDSSAFIGDTSAWIAIDEGDGDRYAYAQTAYLDKLIVDEYGRYNYRYVNGKVEEIPEEEKPPIPIPEPEIPQDEYNLDFDFRLSCLELGL